MFCPNCGKSLPDDAAFCGSCGARILASASGGAAGPSAPASRTQGSGAPASGGQAAPAAAKADREAKSAQRAKAAKRPGPAAAAKRETAKTPGAKLAPAGRAAAAAVQSPAPEAAAEPEPLRFPAPTGEGEMALGILRGDLPAAPELIPGPLKVLGDSLRRFITGLSAAFKDPKKLIPALVLALLWLVLDILKARGVETGATRLLSFLSFAEGGMNGGFLGAVGGILGKGLFAGAVTSLAGLFTAKRGGEKGSPGGALKGGFGFGKDTLWAWLAGIGAALLLYLFFAGGALRMSFMAGAAAAYLAARAALKNGFLKKLFSSVAAGGKEEAGPGVSGLIRGLAAGFAAAALLALAEKRLLLLIPGLVLLLGGGVMSAVKAFGGPKKKAGGGGAAEGPEE